MSELQSLFLSCQQVGATAAADADIAGTERMKTSLFQLG